jgi:AraC-like DNA-binding protein
VLFPGPLIREEFANLPSAVIDQTQIRVASARLRLAAFSLLRAAYDGAGTLALDELAIDLCREVAGSEQVESLSAAVSRASTLSKAKEYLHAHFREPLSLQATAGAVGVGAVYLTQLFRQSVGMPLHQYVMSLRMSEALHEIARATDLTGLALDLGFCSHSHFTAVFRERFGTTPSSLRRLARDGATAARFPASFAQRPLCVARGGDQPGQ